MKIKGIFVLVVVLLLITILLLFLIVPKSEEEENAGLANPAAVYCEEKGYDYEIREGEGGQYGVCIFPDDSECRGWDYYRGECKPGEYFEK